MTKSETRKLKYAVIRNYTYDDKLARKARDWGWKKINEEFGLNKIDTKPRLKPIPKKIETYLSNTKPYREYLYNNNKIEDYSFNINRTKDERKQLWSIWSKEDGKLFPKELVDLANKINDKNGYDPNDAYGFAVVFYTFIEATNINDIEEVMEKDKFDGDIYRKVTAI